MISLAVLKSSTGKSVNNIHSKGSSPGGGTSSVTEMACTWTGGKLPPRRRRRSNVTTCVRTVRSARRAARPARAATSMVVCPSTGAARSAPHK
jgi:hypothetical protein